MGSPLPSKREISRSTTGSGRWRRRLAAVTIDIDEQSRALYHVSGVLASNFLTAIVGEAANLWSQFGYNHSQAMQALLPLIRGTVGNIERDGAAAALTGPIVRGDLGTVQTHLEQLRSTVAGRSTLIRGARAECRKIGYRRQEAG